ncbi:hypothetical protein GCM10009745_53930 [Kribbella yunnanensis]|uniref:Immunity protein 50 of polymorphic toxin system n=1 Tax=Kribbella yunnanensis TaxID=190194 RepID=A0ABN2I8A2_9ACTN
MSDWIAALSNPKPILAVYGGALPSLDRVYVQELTLSPNGPALVVRLDVMEFPVDPPAKWVRDEMNVVQLELTFGALQSVKVTHFSLNPICNFKIQKNGSVTFSGESDSVDFQGVSDAVLLTKISAYQRGAG